jgi:hypothetical protein
MLGGGQDDCNLGLFVFKNEETTDDETRGGFVCFGSERDRQRTNNQDKNQQTLARRVFMKRALHHHSTHARSRG